MNHPSNQNEFHYATTNNKNSDTNTAIINNNNQIISNNINTHCASLSSFTNNNNSTNLLLNDSFHLSAPRASPELSDIGDIISISNCHHENISITPTHSSVIEPVNFLNSNTNVNLSSNYLTVVLNRNELTSTPTHHNNQLAITSNNTNLIHSNSTSVSNIVNTSHLNINGNNNKLNKRKTDFNVNFDNSDIERSENHTDSDIDIEIAANNMNDSKKRKRLQRKNKKNKHKRKQDSCYTRNKCCIYWNKFRQLLKKFVNSNLFVRGILGAILINTLSMGVEHHDQPAELTMVVEYSNYLFTSIFFVEMILKLVADGIFNYIKNAYNVFDGAIVGLR